LKNKVYVALSYVFVALLSVLVTLCCVLAFSVGSYSKLEQLEDLILEKYIGEADQTVMEDAAAKAMVSALGDRWSYYISAKDYAAYEEQMNNAYVGIGITVTAREDGQGLDVKAVTAGGPAEEAGMLAGDIVFAVEGTPVAQMENVSDHIRGEEGTRVKLTIRRDGEELELNVERRSIQVPVATGVLLEGNIGLVTIENFDARCAQETLAVIKELTGSGADKLIFDVRNNPGGYKDELVQILDYLLPEGVIFRSEYYNGATDEDTSDAACLDIPMAVLVNGESYSAAEFFAAAMRDYDKAVVVGEQTCGKGYFQNTYQLRDGSAVGLSVGKYFTPKGENLAGVGIKPDVEVPVLDDVADDIYYGNLEPMKDPQILAAMEALRKQ